MSKFWLVEVADDLEHSQFPTTRHGVWSGIVSVNGVIGLTELRAITLETLAALLMSDEEFAAGMAELRTKRNKASSEAIRRYWRRVQQPQLPGVN